MAGRTANTTKKTTKNSTPRVSRKTAGIYGPTWEQGKGQEEGQVQGQTPGQNQQNQQNTQMMDEQVQQAVAGMDMLNQIDAMEEQTKTMQQEADNKEHDVEFMANKPQKTDLGIIGTAEIRKAYEILKGYQQEKADIEQRIQENEKFWKLNHWDTMQKSQEEQTRIEPKSAWLFNLVINKHADAMDNFPEANILPRAQDDEEVADILSDVIPVILEQNNYEDTYSDCQWYKCKNGTSVQGIFWDNSKNNGIGDVDIKKIDLLNVF